MKEQIIVVPSGKKISGNVRVISSKSELHRLLICASLSDGKSEIHCTPVLSKDIEATISCLEALGAEISVNGGVIRVEKTVTNKVLCDNITLDCYESGSTARFFLPYTAFFRKNATLVGHGKLPQRPMKDLCDCLSSHGAVFSDSFLPITINETVKSGGTFEISGNVSSQYLTGLLFVLPFISGEIKLTTPLESKGYVKITCDSMKRCGVEVTEKDGVYTSKGMYTSHGEILEAYGDWSNGAFFLCGAALSGRAEIDGLDVDSSQPDSAVFEILKNIGIKTGKTEKGVFAEKGELRPFTVDAVNTPDIVPILAVTAAGAKGESVIKNISRLRIKESDRVKSVCELIRSLGGSIDSDENNIYVHGKGGLSGGRVNGYNDHRIVMSAAVAASICENDVEITDYKASEKSYPDFFCDFGKLYGIDSYTIK